MSQPYDPTLKALVETVPEDWPVLVGLPRAPTDVIDADIATVSGAADKVLRVRADPPYLLHLEFQAGHDAAQLPPLLHVRHALLVARHRLLVRSVAVLLRPAADSPTLTGLYECGFPGEPPHLLLRYQVIRVWQMPVADLLSGGLGTLPLAPISAVTEAELPGIIEQMRHRLAQRSARSQATSLWAATYILMGVRYSRQQAALLLQGVVSMKESVTYQAILEEGEAKGKAEGKLEEAKRFLRLQGESNFGPPSPAAVKALERLADLQRLEELGVRLLKAGSWEELLDLPLPRRRGKKSNGAS